MYLMIKYRLLIHWALLGIKSCPWLLHTNVLMPGCGVKNQGRYDSANAIVFVVDFSVAPNGVMTT